METDFSSLIQKATDEIRTKVDQTMLVSF